MRKATRRIAAATVLAFLTASLEAAALTASEAPEREQAKLLRWHVLPAPFTGVVARRLTDVGEWVSRGHLWSSGSRPIACAWSGQGGCQTTLVATLNCRG